MVVSPSTDPGFLSTSRSLPEVTIGDTAARTVYASPSTISVLVPAGLDGGRTTVRVADVPGETALLEVGTPLATGLHQVDNPVFDREGNLYVTYSGTRGQDVPVSIFRVSPTGRRESYVSGIVNPTSMTFDAAGPALCVEPVRRLDLSRLSQRHARAVRERSGDRMRPRVRSPAVCCMSAIDRGRSSPCSPTGPSADRDAARERRGVPSRRRSRRLRVRDGADAWPVRSRVPGRSGDRRDRQSVFRIRTTARDCVRLAGCALCGGGARRIERARIACGPTAAPN